MLPGQSRRWLVQVLSPLELPLEPELGPELGPAPPRAWRGPAQLGRVRQPGPPTQRLANLRGDR